jgi:3-oxoacyl-[acyl-carrier protein] reductase
VVHRASITAMDLGLQGRVALVTGASQGIGRAIAAELVAEGARVAVASRSEKRIAAAAADVGAEWFVHDMSDLDAVPGLLAAVADRLGGPVEVLVCNSGGPPAGPDPLAFTRAQWEAAYRLLVLGPVALIEHALPVMRERRWGRIVAVSSASVREPIPDIVLSNAHRSGLLATFRTMARAVAGDGVTMNSLLTGQIATERLFSLRGGREAAAELARQNVPAGRPGEPEEMAAAAAFLCSTRAAYITGAALRVDGGAARAV